MNKKVNKLSRRTLLKGIGFGAGAAALAACAVPAVTPAPTTAPAAEATAAPAAEATATPEPTTAPAATGTVEIVYWGFSGGLGKTEEKLIQMWNEKQSEVKVTAQVQGNYEETAQKLTAALAAQQGPDMVLLSDVWWFKFFRAKALMPLNDLIKEQNMDTADFVESLWNEGVRKDVQYWIPFARSTPLFYYNADMLEAAGLPVRGPETWDEMREWAPKLVKKEGDTMKVAAFAHPGAASYVAWLFQCVIRQFGGRYSDPDFNILITEPDSIRAGQFYQDTVNKEGWAIASQDATKDFVTGLAATAMLSTGALAGILRDAQFKVGTAFLPKERFFNCCTGGAGLAILSTTPMEKARAAIKYIDYATGSEGGTFWAQNTGYMPVRKSMATSESYKEFFEKVPQAKTAVEQLPLTEAQDSARVFIPGGDQIIGKGLERIMIGNEPVETVFAEVKAILEKEAEPVKQDIAAMG
ncbi:MAG: ABC transporter substrate-binding protein [Thermoflexales bacterium]|nr:ABC transporter substrate-binding protein [Thermoflexales bacterium]MDW8351365.1 ABC transporter substrate-binding protein [Anaerolineae bacterium]